MYFQLTPCCSACACGLQQFGLNELSEPLLSLLAVRIVAAWGGRGRGSAELKQLL
jgi:hypothetical protein